MTEFSISHVQESLEFKRELAAWPHNDNEYSQRSRLVECAKQAAGIPGGFILKIVWDAEGGYPEHAHGYIQYSPRPYRLGYGCDGTTDANIHLLALKLLERLGLDYPAIYLEAYRDRDGTENASWINDLAHDPKLCSETVIPEHVGPEELGLLLHDLNAINNRSVVAELEMLLDGRGIAYTDWF